MLVRPLVLALVLVGFTTLHLLIGGTRLVFALPAFAAIAAAALLASISPASPHRSSSSRLAIGSAAFFFGVVIARSATSPFAYLAWPDLTTSVACALIYAIGVWWCPTPRDRLLVLAVGGGLALFDLAVGAEQFRAGNDWMPFGFLRPADYRFRASGMFICPNHLAGYLEVVALFAFGGALWLRTSGKLRVCLGYLGALGVAGLVLTGSRGGFLAFAAGAATLGALALHRRAQYTDGAGIRRSLLVGLVLVTLGGSGAWLAITQSEFLRARAARLLDQSDLRLRLWPAAIDQFRLAPSVGTGAGTYLIYGRKFRRESVQQDPIHVHNDYLQLLAEYGFIGAFSGLLFLAAHLRAGWRSHQHLLERGGSGNGRSNAAALNQGALAAAAAFAVHSVLDFNLHIPSNALFLAWVASLLANPGIPAPALPRDSAPMAVMAILSRIGLGAAAIWLGWFAWQRAPGEWHAENARVAVRDGASGVAINEAKAGLAVEDQNPWLNFYLGEARWTLAQQAVLPAVGRSFALAAADSYRSALRVFPSDSRILLQLGWVESMLGQRSQADEAFQLALKLDPRNAAIWTFYGHHLRRSGDRPAARRAYQRSLSLSENADARANLRELDAAGADS